MRSELLRAAIAATVFFVAGMTIYTLQHATAWSSSKAGHTVDIYRLESTVNLKALPRQDLNYVD